MSVCVCCLCICVHAFAYIKQMRVYMLACVNAYKKIQIIFNIIYAKPLYYVTQKVAHCFNKTILNHRYVNLICKYLIIITTQFE